MPEDALQLQTRIVVRPGDPDVYSLADTLGGFAAGLRLTSVTGPQVHVASDGNTICLRFCALEGASLDVLMEHLMCLVAAHELRKVFERRP